MHHLLTDYRVVTALFIRIKRIDLLDHFYQIIVQRLRLYDLDEKTMKILHENSLSKEQLSRSPTWLSNGHLSPSKLNIKLKTHSLSSLNIPLETFVGVNDIPSSFGNRRQRTMAGSVDSISELRQQSTHENLSHLSSTQPLLNIVSSIPSQDPPIVKHHQRRSTSFLAANSLNDSVARLRRTSYSRYLRQPSSLQTIDKIAERKQRSSLIRNGSIPKFSFRDLPAISRVSSSRSNNPLKQSSQSQISSFTSLPEIRLFVAQHCSDHQHTINEQFKLPISPSWKKTDSWSWKSTNAFEKPTVQSNQISHSRFELPVIIESPLRPRSSLRTNQQEHHLSSKQSINQHHTAIKLSPTKNSFPHSLSNYEVSTNLHAVHYPSTSHLPSSRQKHLDRFDLHPCQLHLSPLATFDDDDDTDSISSNSSFRSCLDSINEFSHMDTTEMSSVLEGSFQEMSSSYDLHADSFHATLKHSQSSTRHLCILQ